jgi:hypothetical protein
MTSQNKQNDSAKCGGTCEDHDKYLEGFTGSSSPCDDCSLNYREEDSTCEFSVIDDEEPPGIPPHCILDEKCRFQKITDCRPTYYSVRCGKP